MSDPRVLKAGGYLLLALAPVLIVLAIFTDGNNMWLALAGVLPALAALSLFIRAEPERYSRTKS